MISKNDILELINKKSNICVAADVKKLSSLISLIENVGEYICILKLHYDIIEDFCEDLPRTIEILIELKQRYNFFIWEDRKLADIGEIMYKQINNHIIKWADIVSVHPIAGFDSLNSLKTLDISLILIGELSSKGALTDLSYQENLLSQLDDILTIDNIIGIVCQHKMLPNNNLLHIVPGISILDNIKTDNKGQQYRGINSPELNFADILVIGRAITASQNPKEKIKKILQI